MKKIFGIIAIAATFMVSSMTTAKAQTPYGIAPTYLVGSNPWYISANSPDTIVKSTTQFYVAPVMTGSIAAQVSYTFAVDSIGGSPACTATPYVSNDRVHWTAVGSAVVITTHKYWYINTTVPGVSDTCVTVNTNPWTGQWFGLKIVWTSATQRGIYHLTVKSNNTY